jgi:hypothetical protein
MKSKLSIVMALAMVLFFWCGSAMALDIVLGDDAWDTNIFDKRVYDKSHPDSGIASTLGGWYVGLSFFGEKANQIGRVEIVGNRYTYVQDTPDIYYWIDRNLYDYAVFFGHKQNLPDEFEIKAFTKTGDPVNFIANDGVTVIGPSLFLTPSQTAPMAPICTISSMKVKGNGDIVMIFTAPYKNNPGRHIRIRIYMDDPVAGGDAEFRFYPPFEYVRADGSTKGDTIKAIIPAEFSGRTARIEYRLPEESTGYMVRGIRLFQLP